MLGIEYCWRALNIRFGALDLISLAKASCRRPWRLSQAASDFAKNLSRNITIPIVLWDERLSSEGSFKITKELGTNTTNRVKKLDKNAAAFILQGAIDFLSNRVRNIDRNNAVKILEIELKMIDFQLKFVDFELKK